MWFQYIAYGICSSHQVSFLCRVFLPRRLNKRHCSASQKSWITLFTFSQEREREGEGERGRESDREREERERERERGLQSLCLHCDSCPYPPSPFINACCDGFANLFVLHVPHPPGRSALLHASQRRSHERIRQQKQTIKMQAGPQRC